MKTIHTSEDSSGASLTRSATSLSNTELNHISLRVSQQVRAELRTISRQRFVYTALNSFCLIFFSVVLFINARRYQEVMLWAVGVCLLIFSLIQFLELDFHGSGGSLLEDLLDGRKPKQKESQE